MRSQSPALAEQRRGVLRRLLPHQRGLALDRERVLRVEHLLALLLLRRQLRVVRLGRLALALGDLRKSEQSVVKN